MLRKKDFPSSFFVVVVFEFCLSYHVFVNAWLLSCLLSLLYWWMNQSWFCTLKWTYTDSILYITYTIQHKYSIRFNNFDLPTTSTDDDDDDDTDSNINQENGISFDVRLFTDVKPNKQCPKCHNQAWKVYCWMVVNTVCKIV